MNLRQLLKAIKDDNNFPGIRVQFEPRTKGSSKLKAYESATSQTVAKIHVTSEEPQEEHYDQLLDKIREYYAAQDTKHSDTV